jgi:hypothetical protein
MKFVTSGSDVWELYWPQVRLYIGKGNITYRLYREGGGVITITIYREKEIILHNMYIEKENNYIQATEKLSTRYKPCHSLNS